MTEEIGRIGKKNELLTLFEIPILFIGFFILVFLLAAERSQGDRRLRGEMVAGVTCGRVGFILWRHTTSGLLFMNQVRHLSRIGANGNRAFLVDTLALVKIHFSLQIFVYSPLLKFCVYFLKFFD